MLGEALLALGLLLCAYVCVLVLGNLYLVCVHVRHAGRCEPEPRPQPADRRDAGLPLVCVQLPIFNEAALAAAAIDSLCALDWPRERLEIMVLDDSTDDTLSIAAARVLRWREKGVNITHLTRPVRTGFKAGALAAGLDHTKAEYLSIFDADYRPAPAFLRETMPALLHDSGIAFVQARLGYRNRGRNLLTRAQALELDTHFAFEQLARNLAGVPMTFNGTCGVWRRKAIEQAGGWSGRSVAEDQDLSFRVFADGWRCRFLVDVAADGELPETFAVLAAQRARWSTGTAQVARELPWRLVRKLSLEQAAAFVLLTLFNASAAAALAAIAVIALASWTIYPAGAAIVGLGWILTAAFLVSVKTIGAALATRTLGHPTGLAFMIDVVAMWSTQLALLPIAAKALWMGVSKRKVAFLRTPKRG